LRTTALDPLLIRYAAGLLNSESLQGQIDEHKFAAGRKTLFRCSSKEILNRQLIIRSCKPQKRRK